MKNLHIECFPLKTLSRKKNKDKPWINNELKREISKKNTIYRQYIKHPTDNLKQKLKKHQANLKRLLQEAQSQYYLKILESKQTSSKKAWSVINSLINHNSKAKNHVSSLNHNGKEIKDPGNIANALNEYFCNIGSSMASKITSHESAEQYFDPSKNPSIFLSPTSTKEVFIEISKLKDGKPLELTIFPLN